MEFPRQGYWSGLPLPSPRDLPFPEIKPRSPVLKADSLPSEPPGKPLISFKEYPMSCSCVPSRRGDLDLGKHGRFLFNQLIRLRDFFLKNFIY